MSIRSLPHLPLNQSNAIIFFVSGVILIKIEVSRPTRLQNLLQILPAVLVRGLVVMQLLLEIGDFRRRLRALAGKTLVHRVDGDIDEPTGYKYDQYLPGNVKKDIQLTSSPRPRKLSSRTASRIVPSRSTATCGCRAAWPSSVPW